MSEKKSDRPPGSLLVALLAGGTRKNTIRVLGVLAVLLIVGGAVVAAGDDPGVGILGLGGAIFGGFLLIGIPLTVGFVSKWYLILAALEAGWWPVAAVIVASSLLAVAYIWRVIEAAYFRAPPAATDGVKEAPLSMLLPCWLLVSACIYFGVDTSLTLGIAQRAAQFLLGGAP